MKKLKAFREILFLMNKKHKIFLPRQKEKKKT